MPKILEGVLAGSLMLALTTPVQAARDYVWAVGSSTVFPFATVVAERLGQGARLRTPQVESWGSGGGIKLFCRGIGAHEVDIVLVSRDMTEEERVRCEANGVGSLVHLRFGSDGITIGAPKTLDLDLSRRELYLGLARQVPDPKNPGRLVDNPYERWSQVNGALPDLPIEVYGPPATSGTRDVLVEKVLLAGCRTFPTLRAMEFRDRDLFRASCGAIREDGAYIESGETDSLIVRKVSGSDHALGIFGFSYFDQNRDQINAVRVDGVEPAFETIFSGEYPLSRPLGLYVKQAHLGAIPSLKPFLVEMLTEQASGQEGYLVDHGLVPLPEGQLQGHFERLQRTD